VAHFGADHRNAAKAGFGRTNERFVRLNSETPSEFAGSRDSEGFEFGETCFSKLVMARDFWF